MLQLAAALFLAAAPDAGLELDDRIAIKDSATSTLEVMGGSAAPVMSEVWRITNRTFEQVSVLGRTAAVRRTVVQRYASMDNERYADIRLDFSFLDSPQRPLETFSFERKGVADIRVVQDYLDVETVDSVPDPQGHEVFSLATRRSLFTCWGDHVLVVGGTPRFTGHLCYVRGTKAGVHGTLVLATAERTVSEAPVYGDAGLLAPGWTLVPLGGERGGRLTGPFRRTYDWSGPGVLPSFKVRLKFETDGKPTVLEVPVVNGRFVPASRVREGPATVDTVK